MTDRTRPISSSNPPESRGTRGNDLIGDIILPVKEELIRTKTIVAPPVKGKNATVGKSKTVDTGANPA